MVKRGWGRVINLGSTLSVIALPGRAPYASSKAGVMNLSRVLALEWAGTGVTVNTICPGPFATEMNRQLLDDPVKYKALMDLIPMGRWGEVEEIAGAVVFLASDASSFMTGSARVRRWRVDGEVESGSTGREQCRIEDGQRSNGDSGSSLDGATSPAFEFGSVGSGPDLRRSTWRFE